MRALYLIGFMGSGKSSVGERLAKMLDIPFVDTDQAIETKYDKTIATIFEQGGEKIFRTYETEVLKQLPSTDLVISTGGGIVEREINGEYMHNGIIIYLETSFREINKRLEHDQSRPLWNTEKNAKAQLYKHRITLYERLADHIVTTDNKMVDDIANEIVSLLD